MLGLYFLFDNFSSNLFIPVVLYFLSEKVGDEVLRFKLFEKKFTDWGKLAISKFLLQTITLCICIYFDASGNLAFIFFAISGIGTCLIFHEAFKFFTKKRVLFFLRINGGQVKNSFFLIIRNWHIWLFSLLGALVGYLDRIVMMTADAGGLPFFSILVFCMSSIQMGVDFFYITTRRKDFLVGSIEFFKTIRSAKFLQVLAGTIVLACAATIMAFYTLKNYSNISFFIVFLILSNQICLAVNSLAREIIYWTHKIRQALFADIIFWILITVLVILGKILHLSIPVLLSISSACILLRVLAYIYISISIKASASFIPNDKQ